MIMTTILGRGSESTLGSKYHMNGSANSPMSAVNTINTAVSLCLKYFSTRYLSICVETAHSIGPENAKSSHMG